VIPAPLAALVALLSGLLLVGAGLGLFRHWRRLKASTAALLADPLEPRSEAPPLLTLRGRHVATRLGLDDALLPGYGPAPSCEIVVTERETRFGAAWVPHARLVDASFVTAFEGEGAGDGRLLLRLTWRRAGRRLTTVLALEASRLSAERVRKELHLRMNGLAGA
jgi:hypothetical protein